MPIDAGDAIWRIIGDLAPLKESLAGASDLVKTTMDGFLGHATQIGAAFTIVGGAITASLGGAVNAAMDYGGAIQDASDRTSIAAETFQQLQFAGEQSSVGVDLLESSIIRMTRGLVEAAAAGEGPMVDALNAIGLSAQSLQGLSPDQQFLRIADSLSRVTDPAQRTALAIEIFGKSGAQLLPLLNQGSAGIEGMMQKATELGLVLSGDAVSQAEAFGDQWDALKMQFQAIVIQIGSALIPALMEMMPAIQATIASVIQWIQTNPELVTSIVTVIGIIGGIMTVLGPLLVMLPGIIAAFAAVGPVVAAVGAVLAALMGPVGIVIAGVGLVIAIGYALYSEWDNIVKLMKELWTGFKSILETVWNGIVTFLETAAGLALAPFMNFIELAQMGWEGLMATIDVVVGAFESAWDAIVGGFEWVGNQLEGLWNWITGLVESGVQGVVDAVNYLSNLFGLGDVFGGGDAAGPEGKALGGPVTAGVPYIVGERGEELFVPDRDGRIIPNNQTRQMLGGNAGGIGSITINIDGAQDPRATAEAVSRELYRQQVAFGMA